MDAIRIIPTLNHYWRARIMFTLAKKILELARTGAEGQQQELLTLLMDALALDDGESNVEEIINLLRESLEVLKELNELETQAH